MSFDFAPKGWALANGQLLTINQSQALGLVAGNDVRRGRPYQFQVAGYGGAAEDTTAVGTYLKGRNLNADEHWSRHWQQRLRWRGCMLQPGPLRALGTGKERRSSRYRTEIMQPAVDASLGLSH